LSILYGRINVLSVYVTASIFSLLIMSWKCYFKEYTYLGATDTLLKDMLPHHTTANAVFTASKSYDIITVTNSTAEVTMNTLTNTQLQHKADISSTLSEVLYTDGEYHTLCSFYGHRSTTHTQSHNNNTVTHVCARTHIPTHITKLAASVCYTCQTDHNSSGTFM
jgi:hypothetical protein